MRAALPLLQHSDGFGWLGSAGTGLPLHYIRIRVRQAGRAVERAAFKFPSTAKLGGEDGAEALSPGCACLLSFVLA
jgi:hypothetical protein